MPNTFELIASSTVGAGGAASIDFTSIPATFTDLCLKFSARGTTAQVGPIALAASFNTTFNSARFVYGDGSAVASSSTPSTWDTNGGLIGHINGGSSTSNTFSNVELYLTNYASTTTFKSLSVDSVTENNTTGNVFTFLNAGLASTNNAITSISLKPASVAGGGNFAQYTTAYLYGVKNA